MKGRSTSVEVGADFQNYMLHPFKKAHHVAAHTHERRLPVEVVFDFPAEHLRIGTEFQGRLEIVVERGSLTVEVVPHAVLEHELRLVNSVEQLVDIGDCLVYQHMRSAP